MMRTIWLASYPKSGSTWMRVLLANIMTSAADGVDINALRTPGGIASARAPFDALTLIDSGLLTFDEIDALRPRVHQALAQDHYDDDAPQTAMRFVKVHDAYLRTPAGEALLGGARAASGAIVIVRDPRDIAPSLAIYNRGSIDEAIAFMNDTGAAFCAKPQRQHRQLRQRLSHWSGHVASWLDQRDIPVHLISYEDLQRDTEATLRGALTFARHGASTAQIERAVAVSRFDALAAQERARGFREAPSSGRPFFRRGIAGAFRDELTPAQIAAIETDHAPMMQRLGYAPADVAANATALARTG